MYYIVLSNNDNVDMIKVNSVPVFFEYKVYVTLIRKMTKLSYRCVVTATRHEIKRSRKTCTDIMKCQPAKRTSNLYDVISLFQKKNHNYPFLALVDLL